MTEMTSRHKRSKGRRKVVRVPAFWDTSAVVPLCCEQPQSSVARQSARVHARQIVWWATVLEAIAALNRLRREGLMSATEHDQAMNRLTYLRERWSEVQATTEVRDQAERLLGVHGLRTADALQLAAALIWCGNRPRSRQFIGGDGALLRAAEAEGFAIVRIGV